jgi:hypothetical protein
MRSIKATASRRAIETVVVFDRVLDQTHFPWLSNGINSTRTFRNDARLITIEKNPQPVGPRVSGDVPVTEVHPEQIRVGPALVLVEGFEPPLSRF